MAKQKNNKTIDTQAKRKTVGAVDLERIVELDFVRTTEAAALNAYRFLGKGNSSQAHEAAVDAIRGMLDLTCVSATTTFGDGRKPQPKGITSGEKLGNWLEGSIKIDLAAIPIDGIDLVARGRYGALSILVAASSTKDNPSLMKVPCHYMHKIAYGPKVKAGPGKLHIDASVRDNLEIIAGKLGKRIQDVGVAVLERQRHAELIEDIRQAGASVRLFEEGDVGACIAPCLEHSGIDAYIGSGGSAEAVLAAAAIRCLGGDILAVMSPVDEKEKKQIEDALGKDAVNKCYHAEELAKGDNVVFCATGISDSCVLRGIRVDGTQTKTSSVVMRSRYNTVRYIKATHDLSQKTIRLRSANAEARI